MKIFKFELMNRRQLEQINKRTLKYHLAAAEKGKKLNC